MMNRATKTGQYIIALIHSILNDEMPPEKPDDVSFEDVFMMSREHMISVMTYTAIEKLQIKPDEDFLKRWSQSAYTNVAQSVVQLSERDHIYKVLEQHKIPYIPLKGCLAKEMYPKPECREMSDLDILVRRADAAKLKPVMENLGYKCERFDIEKDAVVISPVYSSHTSIVVPSQSTITLSPGLWLICIVSVLIKELCVLIEWFLL